eukprot:TRINITY_DN27030_c0_g1_i1.p1 TRINITY_DN27030_c0_g1~~TRINITY_DN27030_c0_g1_i1.p1  ORF type:complete len:519 (-),score=85.38 TRINITY_DN27030_c0_g1_i1:80-1636(-)
MHRGATCVLIAVALLDVKSVAGEKLPTALPRKLTGDDRTEQTAGTLGTLGVGDGPLHVADEWQFRGHNGGAQHGKLGSSNDRTASMIRRESRSLGTASRQQLEPDKPPLQQSQREQENDGEAGKKSPEKYMDILGSGDLQLKPHHLRLFCFAWSSRRKMEEDVLPEIKRQFGACDGHAIFTDQDSGVPDSGMVRVTVPAQLKKRHQEGWLYHKNMAGILQGWTYLFQNDLLDSYDWVINTEFDHFMRPSKVRERIAAYLQNLWEGTSDEKSNVGKAMMLMWGNAFVFNKEMVRDMQKQWTVLGKVMPAGTVASGCPDWMEGHSFWPEECSQDIVYPTLVSVMKPPLPAYGVSGCGQIPQNKRGVDYPIACWQMDENPQGGSSSEVTETAAIRAIASGQGGNAQKKDVLARVAASGAVLLSVDQDRSAKSVSEGGSNLTSEAARVERILTLARSFPGGLGTSEGAARVVAALENVHADLLKRQVSLDKWNYFYPDIDVPIIHEVRWVSVHALAREMLGL